MRDYGQSILIVDDTELNRSLLRDILGAAYPIMEARDGVEALQVLQEHHEEIALVLLDVVMPNMNGFDVLVQMNEHNLINNVPVIMISAETSPEAISRGYELGVTEYISRPFDAGIIKRRIHNTIMLYAKQKNLERLVLEQMRENEKTNVLMVDILSSIVEFRNGESGMHVQRVRIITEILLEMMMTHFPQYNIDPKDIPYIVNAAALHDIGKIDIPDEIINKPGRLTAEEFDIMKTHAKIGADMLKNVPSAQGEQLMGYAYDICLYHHERWDGRGYPAGVSGTDIPLCAQVVAVADVYDALVSERVYKAAYAPEKAVEMILNGECGAMNPDLLYCLERCGLDLENRIAAHINMQGTLRTARLSKDLISPTAVSASEHTISLLEREQEKYRFYASLTNEIMFDYDTNEKTLVISEAAYEELGLKTYTGDLGEYMRANNAILLEDWEEFNSKIKASSSDNPYVQERYLITKANGEKRWYEITARSMWTSELVPRFLGCVGKMQDVHSRRTETYHLRNLVQRDPLTHLFNHSTARRMAEASLHHAPQQNAALLFIDIDDFKKANEVYGHLFGDEVLKHAARIISANIRKGDVAARVGGDDFVVFLHDVKSEDALRAKAQLMCDELCTSYKGYDLCINMGVSVYPQAGDYGTLFSRAEQALYRARKAGGKCAFYTADLDEGTFKKAASEEPQPVG